MPEFFEEIEVPQGNVPVMLPRELAAVASVAAKDPTRHAFQGVRLEVCGDGTYRVDATDGRVALTVQGEPEYSGKEFPCVPALESAPNGAKNAVIPAREWKAAFKGLPTKGRRMGQPILGNLAVVLGKEMATLVSTDLDKVNVTSTRLLEGKFPDVDAARPKKKAKMTFKVDANLLIGLLTAMVEVVGKENSQVTFEVRDGNGPVMLNAQNTYRKAGGMIMPLAD